MATLYDICKKTGFSTATVSRVINGSGLVKEETRERVLQAIKELNYHPSHAARMRRIDNPRGARKPQGFSKEKQTKAHFVEFVQEM